MPIVPDQPFPKATGHSIRSKDWNDLVYETQRLDNAKVNKAGDAMTGPLTIQAALNQAALGVGTTSPGARLHVQDGANPTVLRIQSTASFGAARVELWSDPQGSASEWRPGYLQSFDQGSFTGGLSFMTNGTGSANRTGSVEAMRLVNGRAGFGVPIPGYRMDVGDRIRLREGASGSAGLWLYQNTPNADRAFIGMNGDGQVGLWGNTGAGWTFNMDTTTGNVGIRQGPAAAGGPALAVNGRVSDAKLRLEAVASNQISISNTSDNTIWYNLPNLSLTVSSPGAYYLVRFQMGGVQATGVTQSHAEYRLLLDGGQQAYVLDEYHANGFELRPTSMERLLYLSAGNHSLVVQWSIKSPQAHPVIVTFPPQPAVVVSLTGCWYGDTRTLMAIEL